jgi:cell division protein FtsB
MAKKQKILIFLLFILFFLILYLIFTSESVKKTDNSNQPIRQTGSASLEAEYKLKTKEFFTAYENLIKNNNFTEKNITELKNNLLALRVPAQFKELHIKFVLILTKMENYLNQKDEREKSDSLQAANQLKADYSWLNN